MSTELKGKSEPMMDFPCNDERIQIVKNQSRELKELTIELRTMLDSKMNALFGCTPLADQAVCGVDTNKPDNWIDEIRATLSDATHTCKDSLDRLSSV